MTDRGNVYIVDDETIIRQSLRLILSGAGYHARPFASGADLVDGLDYLAPGCVLLDVHMPELNGLDVQDRLIDRRPDMPIIFMTAEGSIPMAVEAIRKGAVDFIEKPFGDERLLELVEDAQTRLKGMLAVSTRRSEAAERFGRLTPREAEVMRSLLRGGANKAVAHELRLSTRTVEMHRANIMRKIGVQNFTAAVQLALEAGFAA